MSLLCTLCLNAQNWNAKENGLKAGLRTMGNLGYHFGHAIEFGGTVGYQFNPFIFVGGSASYMYGIDDDSKENKTFAVPICADARVDFLNRQFTPFLEAKVGYSVAGQYYDGMITSAELGVRYHIKNRFAVNLGMSIIYGQEKIPDYRDPNTLIPDENHHEWSVACYGLRLGFEF